MQQDLPDETLAKGMDGDVVVLDGDPARDITAFGRVRQTLRAGQIIYAH